MKKVFDMVTGKEYVYTGRPFKLMLLSPEGILYRGDLVSYSEAYCGVECMRHSYFFSKFLQNFGNVEECRRLGIEIEDSGKIKENDRDNLALVYEMLMKNGFVIMAGLSYYLETKDGYVSFLRGKDYLDRHGGRYSQLELERMRHCLERYNSDGCDFGVVVSSNFVSTDEQIKMYPVMRDFCGEEIRRGALGTDGDSSNSDEIDILIDDLFERLVRGKLFKESSSKKGKIKERDKKKRK